MDATKIHPYRGITLGSNQRFLLHIAVKLLFFQHSGVFFGPSLSDTKSSWNTSARFDTNYL
jgi:hypothetical protein